MSAAARRLSPPAVDPASLRFRPPPTPLPAAAAWALHRAFAAPGAAPLAATAGGVTPRAAAAWAVRLGMAERIASRHGGDALATELDRRTADGMVAAARRAAARNLALRELAALAAATAGERAIPVLLLKGMALLAVVPGLDARRPLADVDLLAEPGPARELALALAAAGLERATVHESAHHLPALYHPRLGTLEIHLDLPGLAAPGGQGSVATAILATGRHRPAPGLHPARVPEPPILAAHAIAHALVQGAHAPAGYPLLRLVADLADLAGEDASPGSLIAAAAPWLTASVSRRELDAVARLSAELAAGTVPAAGSDAARILDHVVAAHLDDDYRRSLKVRALGAAIGRRDWLKVRRRARRALAGGGGRRRVGGVFRVGWSWLSRRLGRGGAANGF